MKQILLFLLVLLSAYSVNAQTVKPAQAKKWQQDLKLLAQQMAERHPDLYHTVSKEDFEKAVNNLHDKIPSLTRNEIMVEIAKVVALVGDGHTSFFPANQKGRFFDFFPVKFWSFSDGIYTVAATQPYKHLLGKRLMKIADTPIEKAFTEISELTGADNKMEFVYSVPFWLNRSELLHAVGITNSPEKAEYIFEGDIHATFYSISLKPYLALDWFVGNELFEGEIAPSVRPNALFATSLMLEHLKQRKYYWFTFLEKEKAIFLQFNTCWDQKDRPTFKAMTEEIFQLMDSVQVERLIIDLRQNSGGEPMIAQPLIEGLAQRTQFIKKKRIFVLLGRRTFSAAVTNATQLRAKANAVMVGEPPRGRPNHFGEGRDINLKKTKIWATVSTEFVEVDPELGDSPIIPIDIEVPLTYESFRTASDSYLEAALKAEIR